MNKKTNKLKILTLSALLVTSSMFMFTGCGHDSKNPKAIVLEDMDIKDMLDDLGAPNSLSDKDLEEYSKKIAKLPDDSTYNEVLSIKDTIDQYLQLKKDQEMRQKAGAREVPEGKNIVVVDTYLTHALKNGELGEKHQYVGEAYEFLLGNAVPVDGNTVVIDVAKGRQLQDGVHKFNAYADGSMKLEDKRGFTYNAIKYVEVSDADYQYTLGQKQLNDLKETLKVKAFGLRTKLNNETLDQYIDEVTNTPVAR